MTRSALASVSVDLDAIAHYLGLHGLPDRDLADEARHAVCRLALPRCLDLFGELGIRATFFVVGGDLGDARSAAAVRRAFEEQHEIGNHSQTHPYDLTRLSLEALQDEIARSDEAIGRLTGQRPKGFRAPGYAISARLLDVLEARGYGYDSSTFPAAPYYLAKACVMGALRLAGRPSRAILDRPRVLSAPRLPYRPSRLEPYRAAAPGHGRAGDARRRMIELPLTVGPKTRLPFIGTSALLMPAGLLDLVYGRLRRLPFLNFELHGIDLLDASDVKLPRLSAVQRELNMPFEQKRARLLGLLTRIRGDFEVRPLGEVAGCLDQGL